MNDDVGRSPADAGSGRSASPEPKVSALRASVPNADALVSLISAWGTLSAQKFHKAYPFFEADRQRVIEEYGLMNDTRAGLEATALLFAEYADEIYAIAMEARQGRDGNRLDGEAATARAEGIAQNGGPND